MKRLRQILTLSVALLVAGPLLILLIGAFWRDFQPVSAIWQPWQLSQLTVSNFATVAQLIDVGRQTFNSLRVVIIAVPVSLLIGSLAGFGLVQLPARLRTAIIRLSVVALLIPPTILWLARFPIFKTLGWLNTPLALIAPALMGGTPFFVLIFYWAFRGISADIFDAAWCEGATLWQQWRYIALPLSSHITIGIAILTFAFFWGNYSDPLLYLRTSDQLTLPVGVQLLGQLDHTRWPVMLAGALLLTLPILIFFLASQRLLQRFLRE